MFSFRQKIFISYVIALLLFLGFMYPFSTQIIQRIAIKAMQERAVEVIAKVQSAPNNEALVERLKQLKATVFFRVSVITNEHKILYDSHTKRLLGDQFSQDYVVNHPEVLEAFKAGYGYEEGYSNLLGQKFAYMAKSFDFHGKTYVMRIAFPFEYIYQLSNDLELSFLVAATVVLLLFSLMTWFMIHHMMSPVQQIINAIKPYQEGLQTTIPEIKLSSDNPNDDFGKLAQTLNTLSIKIQDHIDTVTEERNDKESVLESLGEGVIGVDGSMVITYVNTMAKKLLGFEEDSLVGQSFSVFHQTKCFALLDACQKEKVTLTDTLQIKRGDRKISMDITASPKKDGTGALLVLQDKTAHYKFLEMRKDFIANASHELKTPITIIQGFAETLYDYPNLSREMQMQATEKIVTNSKRMNNLIKDLLVLTDVENLPESRLCHFNLNHVIEKCRQTALDVYKDACISIEGATDVELRGDSYLMELAFNNLIENAAKYSDGPAEIVIVLSRVEKWIRVTVADKGLGIAQPDIEHIFERFYTANKAHSRKLAGSGLGLSIVEMIVSKHFGTISLVSELGKGTTFTLLIPAER